MKKRRVDPTPASTHEASDELYQNLLIARCSSSLPARAFFFQLAYLALRLSAYRIQLGAHFISQWPSLSCFVCHIPMEFAPSGCLAAISVYIYICRPLEMLYCQKGKLKSLSFVSFLFQAIEPHWHLYVRTEGRMSM
jgi:hypothetical protein